MAEIIGQILGIITFGIAFAVYQMKNRKQLIIMQTFGVMVMAVHYLLLGAYPAMTINFFCIIRNLIYYRRDIFSWRFWPLVISIMVMALGIITSNGIWSVLIIAGLTINSYCLSFDNPQHFRFSILITSPMVLIYDIAVFSLGGIMMESISIVSAVIGIIRYSKAKSG